MLAMGHSVLRSNSEVRVQLFVVGTMYVLDEESEPSRGRLLLLQLAGAHSDVRELKFLGETVVNNAAYQVRAMPDHRGRVAATVGNQLVVFTMQPDPAAASGSGPRRAFEVECKHKTLLFAVYLAVHESTLIVGDLMQSVGIFTYDAEKRSLCKVASEYEGALLTGHQDRSLRGAPRQGLSRTRAFKYARRRQCTRNGF